VVAKRGIADGHVAKLAISIARKLGALIFLVPEDIVDVRPRLVSEVVHQVTSRNTRLTGIDPHFRRSVVVRFVASISWWMDRRRRRGLDWTDWTDWTDWALILRFLGTKRIQGRE
jgi:hypothetical protein